MSCTTTASCATSCAARASGSSRSRTPRSSWSAGGNGGPTPSRGSAGCSPSRSTTSTPAPSRWCGIRSASSRCTSCRAGAASCSPRSSRPWWRPWARSSPSTPGRSWRRPCSTSCPRNSAPSRASSNSRRDRGPSGEMTARRGPDATGTLPQEALECRSRPARGPGGGARGVGGGTPGGRRPGRLLSQRRPGLEPHHRDGGEP